MADKYRVVFYPRFALEQSSVTGFPPRLRSVVLEAPDAPAAMRLASLDQRLILYATLVRTEQEEEPDFTPALGLEEPLCS